MNNEIKQISLDLLDNPRIAMRSDVDGDEIEELMASMKDIGLMEPIVVRAVGERYEVIAGHRRTRAAKHLGWPTIEAKIVTADEDLTLVMRLAENLSRHDVDPVDEAVFIGEIMLEHKLDLSQIATMLKRRIEWVQDRLEVFEMPQYLKDYVKQKKIPLGAALWLNRIGNEKMRCHYSHWAGMHGVGVRGAKYWYDMWRAQPDVSNIETTEITDEGSSIVREKPTVLCERCGYSCLMESARNVWVHPGPVCPEPPVSSV